MKRAKALVKSASIKHRAHVQTTYELPLNEEAKIRVEELNAMEEERASKVKRDHLCRSIVRTPLELCYHDQRIQLK